MKFECKPSPRHPELLVYRDGRIYDAYQAKWINLVHIHQLSARGPIALWTTLGKTYTLDVLKMVYETFITEDILTSSSWMIDFKSGNEIKPENLKKTKKYEKDIQDTRPVVSHESWMNGHDDIYMW